MTSLCCCSYSRENPFIGAFGPPKPYQSPAVGGTGLQKGVDVSANASSKSLDVRDVMGNGLLSSQQQQPARDIPTSLHLSINTSTTVTNLSRITAAAGATANDEKLTNDSHEGGPASVTSPRTAMHQMAKMRFCMEAPKPVSINPKDFIGQMNQKKVQETDLDDITEVLGKFLL